MFQNSWKKLEIFSTEKQLMKPRGTGKNKKALVKTKGCNTLLFLVGENTAMTHPQFINVYNLEKLLKNSAEVLFFKIYNSNKENIYPIVQKHLLVLWDLYRMFGVVVITTNLPHIDVLQNSETKTFILDISYSKYHKTPVTLEEIYKQIIWTRGWTEKIKSDMFDYS